MLNQLNSEWIKLKSVRSNLVMLYLAIGINFAIALLVSIFINSKEKLNLSGLFPGQFIAVLFFLVVGVQIIGQEFRYSTIRTTFSSTPNRLKVIFAKLLVLLGAVSASTFVLILLCGLIGKTVFSIRGLSLGIEHSDIRLIIYLIIGNMIVALFGFGVGAIVRQPIAGIIIVLIWPIIIENILQTIGAVIRENGYEIVAKWLPFTNYTYALSDNKDPAFFSPPFAMLYFFAISATLCLIGSYLVIKRDA